MKVNLSLVYARYMSVLDVGDKKRFVPHSSLRKLKSKE